MEEGFYPGMNIKFTIFFLLLLPLLQGCIITDTPGFYSGYKRLGDKQKEQVYFVPTETAFQPSAIPVKIYAVNGDQLRHQLKQQDSTVVYMWSPGCHADVCIAPNTFAQLCTGKGYKAVIVTEYYDFGKLSHVEPEFLPVYSVNHKYYKTDYCNAYIKRFVKDLVANRKPEKETLYSRFLYFKGDQLVKTTAKLDLN